MTFESTETTVTAMFSADEERRYRAVSLAVEAGLLSYAVPFTEPVDRLTNAARIIEDYLRGDVAQDEDAE